MKTRLVPTRCVVSQFLSLCISALSLIGLARGQTGEDVHILPRNHPTTGISIADATVANTTPTLQNSRPLRVDVNLVLVPVTVNDSMNRPVTNLKKDDFVIYEDNKQQELRYFSTEDAPISVAILLDVSKSMSNKIATERAAIVGFFNSANSEDEYCAIAFSDRPRVLADSTQSIDQLQQQLLAVEPGGPTAMLDAVYLAVTKLRSARYKRKAILILSDGGDNASRYRLREIKSLVQESDVQIYAVGLFETFFFNTIEEKLGRLWLSEITDATGGRTIAVDNREKLPEAAAAISREMRNQYVLGYRPTGSTSAKWRKIRVQLTPPGARPLRAYYKRGYFTMQ